MGFITRNTFARGWMPDADQSHGPVDALLRADNLTLDQRGVVALRQGSTVLAALADLDVHSLFTATLNGTRYRLAGAGDAVYANGASIASGLAGSGDVAFAAYHQVLMARGTSKYKYDGSTRRSWGVRQTGTAPTIVAATPDSKTLATCAQAESPAFVVNEGPAATYATGQDGVANGAIVLTSLATTGRATATKTFAAATDFLAYDGGTVGSDDDLLTLWVYVPEPTKLLSLDIMIDVNASAAHPFETDYYFGTFVRGEDATLAASADLAQHLLPALTPAQGARVRPPGPASGVAVSRFRNDLPVANAGWSQLAIRKSQMHRVGATAGKDWKTVIALRLIATTSSVIALTFDSIKLEAARLYGPYEWAYVLAYNSGTYVGLSAPSPLSLKTTLQTQSAAVTVPADTSRDTQVNEIWLFRRGGLLDTFYRVAVKTAVSGTGTVAITDAVSDLDALVIGIALEADNGPPPDNIIAIEGPYFDRVFALTSTGLLAPSRRLNPDSFATGQGVQVSGADETCYWVKRGTGGLYIGTSRDIYRLSGDGAELPDGTINFRKDPLNVDHPPIGDGVAADGNLLGFIAADGWRLFTGEGTVSIAGETSLLYRGFTRHGIAPVNLVSGRFRAAIARSQLVALTPEGSDTTRSVVLYRHVPKVQGWYRHVYPSAFRVVYAERDGTLLAGDTAGRVWVLDSGTQDNGADIPVVLWTVADDYGAPYARKDETDLHLTLDTGGHSIAARLVVDTEAVARPAYAVASTGMTLQILDTHGIGRFRQLQLQLTGTVATFRFGGYAMTAVPRPTGVLAFDSGPIDLGTRELVWVRHCFLKVNATAPLVITITMDGRVQATLQVPIDGPGLDLTLPVDVGRGCVGRNPRVLITSAAEFLPYWIDVVVRDTGKGFDKRSVRVPLGAGA